MISQINGSLLNYTKSTPPANVTVGGNPISDFYDKYRTPVNVAGGALLGAAIGRFAGVPSEAIMSAAGTGAFAGWFAGSPKQAMLMAGGAVLGASIAGLAGVQGAALVGAAGTGTFVGWILS